jgi:hypothetical protein
MATLAEIRQQYPQYSDLSDMQLARALHSKHYSDMEFGTFARKIGMFDEKPVTPTEGYDAIQADREAGRASVLTQPAEYRTALEGAGKFFTDMGLGARQVADAAGILYGRKRNAEPLQAEAEAKRETDQPLMETGAGKAGYVGAGLVSAAPVAAIPGANTVLGAGAIGGAYGALQPTVSDEERLKNTAVGAATGAATQYAGQKIAKFIGDRIASRTAAGEARQAENQVRDLTLAESRRAGYVVPPATTNPTAINRLAESVSGKAQTQQAAAVRNQAITNRLVRKDLGLASEAPLTRETLRGVRERAGQVYKAVKGAGEITADGQFLDDLAELSSGLDEIAKDFPDANVGANGEINKLVDSLLRDRFQASSAVEYLKQLRADASGNLSAAAIADPSRRALGFAQRDAAGALEDMLIRHLESQGKGNLATRFNEARQLIAKTHSVEAALNESTGNVVASRLSSQLKRGKPLSGGVATVARFAQAFPKAAQEMTTSPGVSAVDALIGGAGAATVNPSLLALPVGRMGARSAVLSQPYQNAMTTPSYLPNNRLLEILRGGSTRASIPAAVLAVEAQK